MGDHYPGGDAVRNAQMLFGAENPTGTEFIPGTQNHIGLLVPGISRLDYNGKFWPNYIENTTDKETCELF